MKIAVYTITKNEEAHIERWAESAKDADVRLIVDTGSTDATAAIAESAGADVCVIDITPWRFDDARNAALALVPGDVDYCISLDADEVLLPGWREALESCVAEGVTRPRYKYVWSWEGDKEGVVFGGEHIHPRHGYRWKHPVHETLVTTGEEKVGWCDLEVHHLPDARKSRGQYLPLLELAAEESPQDDRVAHYLGREYMFHEKHEQAATELKRHLSLESATWRPERAASMRYIARCLPEESEQWLLRACAEAPDRRESWVELADYYYKSEEWMQCAAAVGRALSIENQSLDYISEPFAWASLPYDIGAVSCFHLGMFDMAAELGTMAQKIEPDDERIQKNLEYYHAALGDEEVA